MEKIILGHFNICYHDRENSNNKKASTIDSIFTGSNFSRDSVCFTDQVNDHQSIYMIRKKVRNPTHSNTVQGRSYTHFIQEEFNTCIDNELLLHNMSETEPETIWENIEKLITDYLDERCP